MSLEQKAASRCSYVSIDMQSNNKVVDIFFTYKKRRRKLHFFPVLPPKLLHIPFMEQTAIVMDGITNDRVHKLVAIDEAAAMLNIEFAGLQVANVCWLAFVCVFGFGGKRICDQFCMPVFFYVHKLACVQEQLAIANTTFLSWYSTLVDKSVCFSVWLCWKNKAENIPSVSWLLELGADSETCYVLALYIKSSNFVRNS